MSLFNKIKQRKNDILKNQKENSELKEIKDYYFKLIEALANELIHKNTNEIEKFSLDYYGDNYDILKKFFLKEEIYFLSFWKTFIAHKKDLIIRKYQYQYNYEDFFNKFSLYILSCASWCLLKEKDLFNNNAGFHEYFFIPSEESILLECIKSVSLKERLTRSIYNYYKIDNVDNKEKEINSLQKPILNLVSKYHEEKYPNCPKELLEDWRLKIHIVRHDENDSSNKNNKYWKVYKNYSDQEKKKFLDDILRFLILEYGWLNLHNHKINESTD